MKTFTFILLICILMQSCKPQSGKQAKALYFYNAGKTFLVYENENDSINELLYLIKMPVYTSWSDSITFVVGYKIYGLTHYIKLNQYKDTSFTKHKSYLGNIDYIDQDWLKNEENLDDFWKPVNCWWCSGIYDTLVIFLILPKENTDSLICRQVHRWFYQTQ